MNAFKIIFDSPSETPVLGFDQTGIALKEIIEGAGSALATHQIHN